MVSYEFLYGGGGYGQEGFVDPINVDLNYAVRAGQLGYPTGIQTQNQIQEVTNALSSGIKAVELQPIQAQIFEQIPKQHFKEIQRLTKLTGAEPTLHAPMIEPSGFVENHWSEANQQVAEAQLKDVIEKAHQLNPDGNIPVTIHSASSVPGEEIVPDGEGGYKTIRMAAVDRTTGQIRAQFKEEERATLRDIARYGHPITKTPAQQLRIANDSQWVNKIENLAGLKKSADEISQTAVYEINQYDQLEQISHAPIPDNLDEQQKRLAYQRKQEAQTQLKGLAPEINLQIQKSQLFLSNVESSFNIMFEEAYKYSDKETKKKLNEFAKTYEEEAANLFRFQDPSEAIKKKNQLLDGAIIALQQIQPPQIYKSVEDFSTENAAKTLANVAMHAYDKYGSNAPIISIENMHPGMAFSDPKRFKELVTKTKDEFVRKAVADGMSESQAKKVADKQIGVTWDVGHINMMRKQGFKEEDIVKATKLIGKDIKHVHLTDNFGFSDSHLSPGMGNVPIKKILEQMEKSGVNLRDIKMINEAGAFAAGFKTSPHGYLLEAFGSPMYATGAPLWNQAGGAMGGYFAGYGEILPQQHFSMYGAGFSGLPTELGGQVGGARSRMSGAPNA